MSNPSDGSTGHHSGNIFKKMDDIEFEDTILNFDAGFTYLPNPNVQLDFSFGTGINDTMNYLSVGCSWLIPKTSE